MTNDRINKDISRALESNMISQELKIDPFLIDSIRGRANKIKIDAIKKDELGKLKEKYGNILSNYGFNEDFIEIVSLIKNIQ